LLKGRRIPMRNVEAIRILVVLGVGKNVENLISTSAELS